MSRPLGAGQRVLKCSRAAIAVALLAPVCEQGARAQTNDDRGSFAVRELSLSTGYTAVQLPPITLGGYLPDAADLITNGTAAIDWRRVTPRTSYLLELFGTYSARAQYSQLNAPGVDLTFGLSRAFGTRWRLAAGVATAIASSDQLASQPTQARRLVEDAASFDDLAATVAFARSPSPDLAHAALFVPISQSFDASNVYGNRSMISSVRADATYVHSVKLATHFRGSYTTVRRISSRDDPGPVVSSPDSAADSAGIGVRYDRSERTQLTADLGWSQASGATTDTAVSATVGYGWSGRKWFTTATVGAALRPFETAAAAPLTTTGSGAPTVVYSGALGYKFRTQTLLVQYSRAAHDAYGHGGRNTATGFAGNVQSVVGSWSWSPPRSQWTARADFSMFRGPGNFLYIYTWLSTVGIGRELGPNVRLMGELLFDRHGSRGFEGFHLTREGARVNLVWTPPRRPVE
jgi:hypothetical protein